MSAQERTSPLSQLAQSLALTPNNDGSFAAIADPAFEANIGMFGGWGIGQLGDSIPIPVASESLNGAARSASFGTVAGVGRRGLFQFRRRRDASQHVHRDLEFGVRRASAKRLLSHQTNYWGFE
jgi:hypothetical protein